MVLRVARDEADVDAAACLVAEVWQGVNLPSPSPVDVDEDSVTLMAEEDGDLVGTMTLLFRGLAAVACRFAIKRKSVLSAWNVLVAGALEEMAGRKVQVMAATVNPATQRRWRHYLGLVTVSRGSYGEVDGVPAVVMVGSVDAMRRRWRRSRGS